MPGVIGRGIVIGDAVLEGTEQVIRDPAAWWAHGERGTRPRSGHRVTHLVGHWTAGRPHTGPNAGPKVVRAMKSRKRPDGSPMDVGIHFVVSWDGLIWQTADLAAGTVHVGNRKVNASSVGVECCWPGTLKQAEKLGMDDAQPARGIARLVPFVACKPSDEMLEAWRWLVQALTSARHPLLDVPRARGSIERKGVMEHCDVPGTKKVDAGGLLVGALGLR